MKKLIGLFLTMALLLSLTAVVYAADADLAADGWSVANDNFLGWTKDGDTIVGDFNVGWENVEPISLWKDAITDFNNFSVEVDMTASNSTSPFIAVMGVRIETDGNGGDGNQVFIKSNNTENFDGNNKTYDWVKAAGCKAHVTITRVDGGDLTVQIVGESNDAVAGETKTLTVETTAEAAKLEIGVYRGCAKFEQLTVRNGDDVVAPTDPAPTEPDPTDPEPTDPKPTDSKPADPKPTEPAVSDPGDADNSSIVWIVIAGVAVAAVVVVALIAKKKKN